MLRAAIHVGLAAVLVIAPALCCCSVRILAGQIVASSATTCPSCPQSEPATPPCCTPKKTSCCHAEQVKNEAPQLPKPAAPQPPWCDFCDVKPEATLPKSLPTVADPEPTGELLPLTLLGLTTVCPKHLGLQGGLDPPERAGVDTRAETLFARHVLRC